MVKFTAGIVALLASSATLSNAFSTSLTAAHRQSTALQMADGENSRRTFMTESVIALGGIVSAATVTGVPAPASARVFLDPAMYGDQELRVSAVDSLREAVRRSLLQNPKLVPYFLELALLDGLSYNTATNEGGPDGSIIKAVMSSKETDAHTKSLQECAQVLLEAKKNLKKMSSITIADAVALAGAEAVAAVGGPVLPCQLGRTDTAQKAPIPSSMPPINLFTGDVSYEVVLDTFRSSGLTEREMTALLGCLLSIDSIEKATPEGDWKQSQKPKFREAGKMGRMSEFKPLTDEDIANELAKDDEESYKIEGDDDWYIADTFGTQEDRFGKRVNSGEKPSLSTALKNLAKSTSSSTQYSWVKDFLLSKDLPTAQTWVQKYGSKPLIYEKDLKVAYNSVTQLGGEFTGGKYESLLKNKKRKTLNDDDLDFLSSTMGPHNLHKEFICRNMNEKRDGQRQSQLKDLKGIIGVDASGWFHRSVHTQKGAAVYDMNPKVPLFDAFDKFMTLLNSVINTRENGEHEVILFMDGRSHPLKEANEGKRREQRLNTALNDLKNIYEHGDAFGTYDTVKKLRTAIAKRRDDFTAMVAAECQKIGVHICCAPFEADWQLIEAQHAGLIDIILSEDGDLFVIGGDKIVTDIDYVTGECCLYERSDILQRESMGNGSYADFLPALSNFLGNDYIDRLDGNGPVAVRSLMGRFVDSQDDTEREMILEELEITKKWNRNDQRNAEHYTRKFWNAYYLQLFPPVFRLKPKRDGTRSSGRIDIANEDTYDVMLEPLHELPNGVSKLKWGK